MTLNKKLLVDTRPIQLSVEESSDGTGKVRVRGEFARAGTTENKRYYSEKIWEKEINRLGGAMKDRRVFGHPDHPCLLSDDFRVLTADGWRPFRDVAVGDRVWSRVDGAAVLSRVEEIIDTPYTGPAYKINTRSINSGFTAPHKMLLVKRPDGTKYEDLSQIFVRVDDIVANKSTYSHSAIPKTAEWKLEGAPVVVIPGIKKRDPKYHHFKNNVNEDLVFDSELFAAFMGLYLSEGSLTSESSDNYGIQIHQTTEWSKKYIKEQVLDKFPTSLRWSEEARSFFLSDIRLYEYLRPLGDCYNKYVPKEIKNLSKDSLHELLFWFSIGDGRIVHIDETPLELNGHTSFKSKVAKDIRESFTISGVRRDVFSVSKRLIDDLHECAVKSGYCGSLATIMPDKDYEFAGHTIKADNKVPLYQLHLSNTRHIRLYPPSFRLEEVHHDGNIYCLRTTHGSFYMEQNGRSFWTGNSDGRTSLEKVSHIVTGMKMEDGVLVGEAEILDTDKGRNLMAILKSGCKVGISSRGFGSTKPNDKGEDVVQEDYKLMTFDFVADPADQQAYPEPFFEGVEFPMSFKDKERERAKAKELEERIQESGSDKSKLADEVLATIASLREDIKAEVRGELLSDPHTAGARGVVDKIMDILRPHVLPEDAESVVKAKETEISKLKRQIGERDLQIKDLQDENTELVGVAKEASYRLYIERQLAGDPDAALVKKTLGDVKVFESSKALKTRLSSIREELTKRRNDEKKVEEARVKDAQRAKDLINEISDAYEAKLDKLGKVVENLTSANKGLALQNYTAKKLQNHPRAAKIRSLIETATPSTKQDVDNLFEHFTPEAPKDDDDAGAIRARIRRLTRGGHESSPAEEEKPRPSRVINEDFNGLGVDLGSLRKLSGIYE